VCDVFRDGESLAASKEEVGLHGSRNGGVRRKNRAGSASVVRRDVVNNRSTLEPVVPVVNTLP